MVRTRSWSPQKSTDRTTKGPTQSIPHFHRRRRPSCPLRGARRGARPRRRHARAGGPRRRVRGRMRRPELSCLAAGAQASFGRVGARQSARKHPKKGYATLVRGMCASRKRKRGRDGWIRRPLRRRASITTSPSLPARPKTDTCPAARRPVRRRAGAPTLRSGPSFTRRRRV